MDPIEGAKHLLFSSTVEKFECIQLWRQIWQELLRALSVGQSIRKGLCPVPFDALRFFNQFRFDDVVHAVGSLDHELVAAKR